VQVAFDFAADNVDPPWCERRFVSADIGTVLLSNFCCIFRCYARAALTYGGLLVSVQSVQPMLQTQLNFCHYMHVCGVLFSFLYLRC